LCGCFPLSLDDCVFLLFFGENASLAPLSLARSMALSHRRFATNSEGLTFGYFCRGLAQPPCFCLFSFLGNYCSLCFSPTARYFLWPCPHVRFKAGTISRFPPFFFFFVGAVCAQYFCLSRSLFWVGPFVLPRFIPTRLGPADLGFVQALDRLSPFLCVALFREALLPAFCSFLFGGISFPYFQACFLFFFPV